MGPAADRSLAASAPDIDSASILRSPTRTSVPTRLLTI